MSTPKEFRVGGTLDPAIVVGEVLGVPSLKVGLDSKHAEDGTTMVVIVRRCAEREVAAILAREINDEVVGSLVGGFFVVNSPRGNGIDIVAATGHGDKGVVAVTKIPEVKKVSARDVVDVRGSGEVAGNVE